MTFTKEQLEALSPWEYNYHTAIEADWASTPGRDGLDIMYQALHDALGDNRIRNYNCNHCIVRLCREVGRLYFADKAELAKRVELSEAPAKKVRKTVKTKK